MNKYLLRTIYKWRKPQSDKKQESNLPTKILVIAKFYVKPDVKTVISRQ